MARIKQSIVQRAYTYMETREDLLESDDVELRQQSLRGARNMRALATRACEARPGTFFVRSLLDAEDVIEFRPESGLVFGLILNDASMQVINDQGVVVHVQNSVPWTDATNVWVSDFRETLVIGETSIGLFELVYSNGEFSFRDYVFEEAAGGELAQPYWAYEQDVIVTPSALTGNITLTASSPIWTAEYVGQRVRYGTREIFITARNSATVVQGVVINRLPPSFAVTVDDASEYRVGEVVVGADTNFQGLIIAIAGNVLSVVTISFFEGPDAGEELSGPAGSASVSSSEEIDPLPSPIWDEPLISPLRGYPGAASAVSGRLVFIDFPAVPDLIALSSSRNVRDFNIGTEDDDAIVRQVGDSAPRWRHAVNMGDLVLLADNGVYIVPARSNGLISPSTFNTVFIDDVGANEVKPVKADDAVIFVESSGRRISVAVLDGNVQLKWSVRPLTTFHNQLIKRPKRLCGAALGSSSAEKYMFIVNEDGTLAAASWRGSLRDEQVGFAPWDTAGEFVNVSPVFGAYWAIVDRVISTGTARFLERFDDDAFLDCAASADYIAADALHVNGEDFEVNGQAFMINRPALAYLPGVMATFYSDGWDGGDFMVNADGTVDDEPPIDGQWQVGLNFEAEMSLWPAENIQSPRIGMLRARVIRLAVSVQDTLGFKVRLNRTTRRVPAYVTGDDLTQPPPVKTKVYKFSIFGNRDHPEMVLTKDRPGPFRVLATTQEVQA